MKTNAKAIIAFFLLAIAFLAFRKGNPTAKIEAVKSVVTNGKWKVNLYRDNGLDQTNNYTGYELRFKPNGTLIATKDETLHSGTWRTIVEDRMTKLYLDFDTATHLDELSEDWLIKRQESGSFELEDLTTGHGGVDYLNLQKLS
jgi:hypothetical protein